VSEYTLIRRHRRGAADQGVLTHAEGTCGAGAGARELAPVLRRGRGDSGGGL